MTPIPLEPGDKPPATSAILGGMRRRTGCLIVVLVAVVTWLIGFGCWPILIWSSLNCWSDDIDINFRENPLSTLPSGVACPHVHRRDRA